MATEATLLALIPVTTADLLFAFRVLALEEPLAAVLRARASRSLTRNVHDSILTLRTPAQGRIRIGSRTESVAYKNKKVNGLSFVIPAKAGIQC